MVFQVNNLFYFLYQLYFSIVKENLLTFGCLDDAGINNFLEHEDNKKAENIQFITDFDNISDGLFEDSISQKWEN